MSTISATSTGLPTGAVTTKPANPVAASTKLSRLGSTAAKLGQDASVIATLGGSTSSTTPLYNAVGLMNEIVNAGPSATTGTTGNGTNTGTSSGTSAGSTDVNTNWATALKAQPGLAGIVAGDSTKQAILSTLSTIA